MIQFNDVSLTFSGHLVFKGASFTLQKGERCGLVGRNGSGKTTLLRLITGQMLPDEGVISIPKGYRIGYLQQHIHFTEPTLLQEAALGLPENEKDHLYKVEKILFGLGFSEQDLEASPDIFSGGYHLRLHLAKVLVSEPDCLLLDEPTNYLDIVSIRWLKRFLLESKREFILISHDREFMDSVTTHTLGIHREKVRKVKGSSIDFFEQIVLEEEVYEKTRLNAEKKRAHAQSYVDRFGAKASKAAQAQSRKKMIERIPVLEQLKDLAQLSFSFHEAPFPGKKMLEGEALAFSYTREPLLHDISLMVEKGERIAIIGKNGRGKSTLLRLFMQDLQPSHGTLKIAENVRIGYFGQTHIERLNPGQTVEEAVASANTQLTFSQVKGICGLMMFSGDLAKKKTSVLSGGEKSRVLLGKILAKPCNLLLLDEPTHHLDIESIEALIDALEEFNGALIIVTHSELILRRLAVDKLIVCEDGKQTLFLGSYDDFLEKEGWEEEKGVKSLKPKVDDRRLRAELVNQRSKILKPLEKDIQTCEEKITVLEREQEKELSLLAHASSSEIHKSIGQRQKTIDALYEQLEQLYLDYERKKESFNVQLSQQ